jgi:hypothetical protein
VAEKLFSGVGARGRQMCAHAVTLQVIQGNLGSTQRSEKAVRMVYEATTDLPGSPFSTRRVLHGYAGPYGSMVSVSVPAAPA